MRPRSVLPLVATGRFATEYPLEQLAGPHKMSQAGLLCGKVRVAELDAERR